jgi:hypothetical protein
MNNKDIHNLSNIYQNILNEAKVGDSLSQPIQLGSGINKGGPAGTVLLKIKKKKRKKLLEKSGFFGGFLKGMEQAQTGKLPFGDKKNQKDQEKTQSLGFKNPPKIGQVVILSGNNKIRGVVMSKINKEGQYKIKLIGKTANAPSPYTFFITDRYPEGIITNTAPKGLVSHQSNDFMAGYGTAYPNWIDYKAALKSF